MSLFARRSAVEPVGSGIKVLIIFRLLNAFLKLLVRLVYRVRVVGAENIPNTGSALLVANHVSYVDALIITAVVKRPVRFMIWRTLYNLWGIGRIVRLYGAMPVSAADGPHEMRRSIETVVTALKQGALACLFPEGAMTRTTHVQPFKRGLELIARRSATRIIPVHLDRLWGSVFSYEKGRYFFKVPKLISRPVQVTFGKPLPPDTDREQVRQKIIALGAEAFAARRAYQRPLHVAFLHNAKRAWWWPCMTGALGLKLSWGKALAHAITLGKRIRKGYAEEKEIGIMMPASVGSALANIAVLMAGKVPVNLNYTGPHSVVEAVMKRRNLRTVFTSRKLLRRSGFPDREEYVHFYEMLSSIPRHETLWNYILAYVLPSSLAERRLMHRGDMDDLATIMFTNGATGLPKGAMLTHHNVTTNIESVTEALRLDWRDMIMGVLPPFHCFGFTITLWLPLVSRIRVTYHPNPLHAKGVGRMVQKHRASILIGTPSFFALYTRGCTAEQFSSLRLAMAGGQKLQPAIAEAFERRFGLELHEGYGCTELSPIVSVNVPSVRHHRGRQITARKASVGRPVPGIIVRIVDPESHEELPNGSAGMVLVRGANVMRGYVDDPHGTSLAIRDGWYYTRDIGMMDRDGFLHIHDRITRLSKIAGQTVQHAVVEELLRKADAGGNRQYAVVSLPHPVRGQRLAVVYEGPELDPGPLLRKPACSETPNLWLPAARDFVRVPAIPRLPNAEPDFNAVRRLAAAAEAIPSRTADSADSPPG